MGTTTSKPLPSPPSFTLFPNPQEPEETNATTKFYQYLKKHCTDEQRFPPPLYNNTFLLIHKWISSLSSVVSPQPASATQLQTFFQHVIGGDNQVTEELTVEFEEESKVLEKNWNKVMVNLDVRFGGVGQLPVQSVHVGQVESMGTSNVQLFKVTIHLSCETGVSQLKVPWGLTNGRHELVFAAQSVDLQVSNSLTVTDVSIMGNLCITDKVENTHTKVPAKWNDGQLELERQVTLVDQIKRGEPFLAFFLKQSFKKRQNLEQLSKIFETAAVDYTYSYTIQSLKYGGESGKENRDWVPSNMTDLTFDDPAPLLPVISYGDVKQLLMINNMTFPTPIKMSCVVANQSSDDMFMYGQEKVSVTVMDGMLSINVESPHYRLVRDSLLRCPPLPIRLRNLRSFYEKLKSSIITKIGDIVLSVNAEEALQRIEKLPTMYHDKFAAVYCLSLKFGEEFHTLTASSQLYSESYFFLLYHPWFIHTEYDWFRIRCMLSTGYDPISEVSVQLRIPFSFNKGAFLPVFTMLVHGNSKQHQHDIKFKKGTTLLELVNDCSCFMKPITTLDEAMLSMVKVDKMTFQFDTKQEVMRLNFHSGNMLEINLRDACVVLTTVNSDTTNPTEFYFQMFKKQQKVTRTVHQHMTSDVKLRDVTINMYH